MKKIKPYLIIVLVIVILHSFVSGYFDLKMAELNLYNFFTLLGYIFPQMLISLLIAGAVSGVFKGWKNIDWNKMILFFIVFYFLLAILHYFYNLKH